MAFEETVLSLNPDGQKLRCQEAALRDGGFQVITVTTPLQARFEIEMGRCGIFLTSSITPTAIYRDLAALFKRNCPDGLLVYLSEDSRDPIPVVDLLISEGDEPQAIVRELRSRKKDPAILPGC